MEPLKKESHFDTIEEVLEDAKTAPRDDYFVYERYKPWIWDLSNTCAEYQTNIKILTDILEI